MEIYIKVISDRPQQRGIWQKQISAMNLLDYKLNMASDFENQTQWIWIDGALGESEMRKRLGELERKGQIIFVIQQTKDDFSSLLHEGLIDDVIVKPFRSQEILSKIRHYEHFQHFSDLSEVNSSAVELLDRFGQDLRVLETLQKAHYPDRFPGIEGFQIVSRYLAGMRSGGDYFDVAESESRSTLSLLLTNSTSYGLTQAVINTMVRVTLKVTQNQIHQPGVLSEVVGQVQQELARILKPKDQLSLFYGVIHRKTLQFRWVNLGGNLLYYSEPGDSPNQKWNELSSHGPPIRALSAAMTESQKIEESHLTLRPGGKMMLVSEGLAIQAGGKENAIRPTARTEPDLKDVLNHLFFQVQSRQDTTGQEFLERDCTGIVLEVQPQPVALIKG